MVLWLFLLPAPTPSHPLQLHCAPGSAHLLLMTGVLISILCFVLSLDHDCRPSLPHHALLPEQHPPSQHRVSVVQWCGGGGWGGVCARFWDGRPPRYYTSTHMHGFLLIDSGYLLFKPGWASSPLEMICDQQVGSSRLWGRQVSYAQRHSLGSLSLSFHIYRMGRQQACLYDCLP